MKRKIGDRCACTICGQDIEWHGRPYGWIDRGGNSGCVAYLENGEVVKPKKGKKHTIRNKHLTATKVI